MQAGACVAAVVYFLELQSGLLTLTGACSPYVPARRRGSKMPVAFKTAVLFGNSTRTLVNLYVGDDDSCRVELAPDQPGDDDGIA